MSKSDTVTVACERMGPHDAMLVYRGEVCNPGVAAMHQHLKSLFGYYKYTHIDLLLESPGGSIESMHYLLRQMRAYEAQGCSVSVHSTFLCASAAAILLAMGNWGGRSVEASTTLVFHSARIEQGGSGLTAALSGNLSQTLINIDQQLVDTLVKRMVQQTGSAKALASLMQSRCNRINDHLDKWPTDLMSSGTKANNRKRPDWLKSLTKLAHLETESGRFINELKKHLLNRMQVDTRMDVREAFGTCLIDKVVDAIH